VGALPHSFMIPHDVMGLIDDSSFPSLRLQQFQGRDFIGSSQNCPDSVQFSSVVYTRSLYRPSRSRYSDSILRHFSFTCHIRICSLLHCGPLIIFYYYLGHTKNPNDDDDEAPYNNKKAISKMTEPYVYRCPEKSFTSLTTPTATFREIYNGLLFRLSL